MGSSSSSPALDTHPQLTLCGLCDPVALHRAIPPDPRLPANDQPTLGQILRALTPPSLRRQQRRNPPAAPPSRAASLRTARAAGGICCCCGNGGGSRSTSERLDQTLKSSAAQALEEVPSIAKATNDQSVADAVPPPKETVSKKQDINDKTEEGVGHGSDPVAPATGAPAVATAAAGAGMGPTVSKRPSLATRKESDRPQLVTQQTLGGLVQFASRDDLFSPPETPSQQAAMAPTPKSMGPADTADPSRTPAVTTPARKAGNAALGGGMSPIPEESLALAASQLSASLAAEAAAAEVADEAPAVATTPSGVAAEGVAPSQPATPARVQFRGQSRDSLVSESRRSSSSRSKPALFSKQSLTFTHAYNTEKVHDYYEFEEESLGSGSYGCIYAATNKTTGVRRAIKSIAKDKLRRYLKDVSGFVRREFDILRDLDHPNIIKIFETFEDYRNMYIVEELCTGGDLLDKILRDKKFGERDASQLMHQLVSPVVYLHAKGILHRDLKPENYLFHSPDHFVLKLIDFGLSKKIQESPEDENTAFEEGDNSASRGRGHGSLLEAPGIPLSSATAHNPTPKIGTPMYMAPEVMASPMPRRKGDGGRPTNSGYDYRADVWSLGVILHVVLSGRFPAIKTTPESYFKSVHWEHLTLPARDLMCRMLQKNPSDRIDAEGVMRHVWIRSHAMAPQSHDAQLGAELFTNLKAFAKEKSLKKVALNVVARELTEDQIVDLARQFKSFDINGDGMLTFQELKMGIEKCSDLKDIEAGQTLLNLFEDIDTDGSGQIDYTEFLAATMDQGVKSCQVSATPVNWCVWRQKHLVQEDVCWRAFKRFDVDGSGTISAYELHEVLNQDSIASVLKKSRSELEKLVKEVDVDGDGEINFDEFIQMMRG